MELSIDLMLLGGITLTLWLNELRRTRKENQQRVNEALRTFERTDPDGTVYWRIDGRRAK